MDAIYFDSEASRQEAERFLQRAGLETTGVQPLFGARPGAGETAPVVIFANRAMLALFRVADLKALSRRLFQTADPGARRLATLIQKPLQSARPRLERLRFYFGLEMMMFTFACHWQGQEEQSPFFGAAVLDAPTDLSLSDLPVPEPEPAPVPAPATAEPPIDAPLVARKPMRFLWRTDAEDRFTEITPPLPEIVGEASASLIGKTISEAAQVLGLDPDGVLARAVAKRDTWSSIEVMWPIAETERRVPVGLGALPAFDRERRFEGYHGFGVIYVDRLTASSSLPVKQASETETAAFGEAAELASIPAFTAENVILLRPLGMTSKLPVSESKSGAPLDDPAPEEAESVDLQAQDLSSAEQDAFEEIGRALTDEPALLQVEEPVLVGSAEETSAEVAQTGEEIGLGFSSASTADEPSHELPQETGLPAAEPALELEQLGKNAAAIFAALNAGLLVLRNEEPIFANQLLLDLLGYADLTALHQAGAVSPLLTHARSGQAHPIDLLTRQGTDLRLLARQQCIEWDNMPATLLILQQGTPAELESRLDGKLAHYESESRELNAILDTATDGVAVLDAKGRILTLNRSGEALFGYDQNEVIGEPFSLLFNAESSAIAEDYLEGLKSHGMKSLLNDGREVVGRARQGGLIPIFMTLGRVTSSHAEEADVKFCALLRDMTHWKKVEQELDEARKEAERASALKSDFLAKVSHEIRTPLNAIIGFAEVIMEERFGAIGNERYKDYLKDIHMSGVHVMSLVNDLLDLSKIEAGKLELNFQEIDANRIISECVMLMQPQANRERVIMRTSLSAQLPHICADERSLRQIILNLLSNAVKFNEPGGQVIVATVSADSGHAIIRIKDTGIGMSEEDIGTALEPFRQLATTRQTIGTGLGLPLTKALVEANKAFFSIKSKKQEGTLVEVTFPVMRVSA